MSSTTMSGGSSCTGGGGVAVGHGHGEPPRGLQPRRRRTPDVLVVVQTMSTAHVFQSAGHGIAHPLLAPTPHSPAHAPRSRMTVPPRAVGGCRNGLQPRGRGPGRSGERRPGPCRRWQRRRGRTCPRCGPGRRRWSRERLLPRARRGWACPGARSAGGSSSSGAARGSARRRRTISMARR